MASCNLFLATTCFIAHILISKEGLWTQDFIYMTIPKLNNDECFLQLVFSNNLFHCTYKYPVTCVFLTKNYASFNYDTLIEMCK